MKGFAATGPILSGAAEAEPDHVDPAYEVAAPNLTPDPETGVLATFATDAAFIDRIRKVGAVTKGTTEAGPFDPREDGLAHGCATGDSNR